MDEPTDRVHVKSFHEERYASGGFLEMSFDSSLTLAVVGATVAALARELFPPPATVLGAVIVLLVLGRVDAAGGVLRVL